MNTYELQPEFITNDVRVTRPAFISYRVDADFMTRRHQGMCPEHLIKNKTVLDLGCAVAATGGWVLSHGASHYTGVELQTGFADIARTNLTKYYQQDQWEIYNGAIEDFLAKNEKQFDVIVISGVLYGIVDYYSTLKKLTEISKLIVLESIVPSKMEWPDGTKVPLEIQVQLSQLPLVQYVPEIGHSDVSGVKSIKYQGTFMTIPAVEAVMGHLGWAVDRTPADTLARTIPDLYDINAVVKQTPDTPGDPLIYNTLGARYAVWCTPSSKQTRLDFHEHYALPESQRKYTSW